MLEETEIIDLDDQTRKSKHKFCSSNCINFQCSDGADMMKAPFFACFYYGANTQKKKKHFVCKTCLDVALDHQEELVTALINRKPIFQYKFPDNSMKVEISDSDESDSESNIQKDEFLFEKDMLAEFETKVENELNNIFEKYDINYQFDQANVALTAEWDEIKETNKKLDNVVSNTAKKLDKLRSTLYTNFKPNIQILEELNIEDSQVSDYSLMPSRWAKRQPQLQMLEELNSKNTEVFDYSLMPNEQAISQPQSHMLEELNSENPRVFDYSLMPNEQAISQPQSHMLKELNSKDSQVSDYSLMPNVWSKSKRQLDQQLEIFQEVVKCSQSMNLPPSGKLIRPTPEVNDTLLVMKNSLSSWIKGKVEKIVSKRPSLYYVDLLQKKHTNPKTIVSGKQIALDTPSKVIVPVGTRVVAIFKDTYSSNYYSGIIAESPKYTNTFRYLVFFDDGYAQYVKHENIFLICESSTSVWEDIPLESRSFIKKYLESYPERPMVKLQPGQVVKTEWNGKWWIARVREVDASLVHMQFDADHRTEWIYRGSARLGPLYSELLKANLRQQGNASYSYQSSINSSIQQGGALVTSVSDPYVEYTYTTNTTDEESSSSSREVQETVEPVPQDNTLAVAALPQDNIRAVARKSTAKKTNPSEALAVSSSVPTETKPSHSVLYFQTRNKIQTKEYFPHKCGQKCVEDISFAPEDLHGYSPLSIPLLCGWNRQLCKFSKIKKAILYQTPCGIRLRNMDELHAYLKKTECSMSVDLFEFDYWVRCLAEFELDQCFVKIKDLSYGEESVPVQCVNEINYTCPDALEYTTKRIPTEDVHMNLDPEFLCGCDCEDDCIDKNKCQCWQLTIDGATLGGRMPNAAVGYNHKRLHEAVVTGIYECNSRCKCSVKTCLNRVVQHPMNLKLQVFKTESRGWGIRCLNDIPVGSFICVYAGRLLTEQGANEGGKNYGDEYLAELDYIEVVEGVKEGYESCVIDPETGLLLSDNSDVEKESQEQLGSQNINKKSSQECRTPVEAPRNNYRRIILNDSQISDESSEDEQSPKGSQTSEDDNVHEPSKLDLAVDTEKIEKNTIKSVRHLFGKDESVYIMDAKTTGNIGRFLNHSCDPNVFVQNVFVDTHDVRFPWVAFFALKYIKLGQELTWNYRYDVGSVPGIVIICKCGASNCRGRLL